MSEIANEAMEIIQIERHHSRLKRYLQEGEALLKQVLPQEEAELVSCLLGYTLLSAWWSAEGYGPAVTSGWIRREAANLKGRINKVRRKYSL